jgi:hypothetical protein
MTDIINQIDGKVQIIFEFSENNQTFRDAIWMTQEEYDSTSPETIEATKQVHPKLHAVRLKQFAVLQEVPGLQRGGLVPRHLRQNADSRRH